MGSTEYPVVFKEVANKQILEIMKYIALRGNPERAVTFADQLFDFGNTLGKKPEKYQHCRKPSLERKGYRCTVFKKNYIFIYYFDGNEVIIYSIIHAKRYVL